MLTNHKKAMINYIVSNGRIFQLASRKIDEYIFTVQLNKVNHFLWAGPDSPNTYFWPESGNKVSRYSGSIFERLQEYQYFWFKESYDNLYPLSDFPQLAVGSIIRFVNRLKFD